MPKCSSCKHYRLAESANSPAVALKWLADSGEPQVYQELREISVQEHERHEGERQRELEYRQDFISHLDANVDFTNPPQMAPEEHSEFRHRMRGLISFQFATAPETVTHCAVHAERDQYYIPALKNWAETCEHHELRTQLPVCRKCRYYQPSTTEARLRDESTSLINAIVSTSQDGGSILRDRSGKVDQAIGPGKAHDLKTAYYSKGRLLGKLAYLPFCQAPCPSCSNRQAPDLNCGICHGQGEQIVQPEIFNRFQGCQCFQPLLLNRPQGGLASPSVPAPGIDPAEIPEGSITILEPGSPPLTDEMLRRSVAVFVELATGPVSAEAERAYSAFVRQAWHQSRQTLIEMQLKFIRLYDGDRTDTGWRPEATALFQQIASMAPQTQSKPGSRPPSTPKSRVQPAPTASVGLLVCKNGHQNAPDRLFCDECGKPVQ